MKFTQHAIHRMQQRGIPQRAVDTVLAYGFESYDHHGACLLFMDKRAQARLRREQGAEVLRELEKFMRVFVVTSTDGTVITVGHRYRRIRRH